MKTKALISCVVTPQLICVFVFAYSKAEGSFIHTCKNRFAVVTRFDQRKFVKDVSCIMRKSAYLPMCKMSLVMRQPAFCICENKDADQLRGNREADQCLCFRYSDSMIPLLSKSKISRL